MKHNDIEELIGKTNLSFYLDTQYNKGKISAMQLEEYYKEIKQIIRRAVKECERECAIEIGMRDNEQF